MTTRKELMAQNFRCNMEATIIQLEDAMQAFSLLITVLREHNTGGIYLDAIDAMVSFVDRLVYELRDNLDGGDER